MIKTKELIRIRGTKGGLLITFGDGAYADVLAQLSAELGQKKAFLQGSRVTLALGRRPLHQHELAELQTLFNQHQLTLWTILADDEHTRRAARNLDLAIRLPGSHTDLDGNSLKQEEPHQATATAQAAATGDLLLRETIRSGRSIYHEGHITIIGDVNPGAEVIAVGHVVVWGRLRGLVHAGAMGDKTAVICALDLNPTQLRIADQIAISPNEHQRRPAPEQAAIQNGRITAQPWQVRGRE